MSPLTCLSSSDFPQGVKGRNREEDVTRVLEVIYDAVFIPKLNKDAKMYIKKLSKSIFEISIHKQQNRDFKSGPNRLLHSYLDTLLHALAKDQPEQVQAMQDLVVMILKDLVAMKNLPNVIQQDILPILYYMMNYFTALCLDEHAGYSGIKLMTKIPHRAYRCTSECKDKWGYWELLGLLQGWKPKAGEWRATEEQYWLTGL